MGKKSKKANLEATSSRSKPKNRRKRKNAASKVVEVSSENPEKREKCLSYLKSWLRKNEADGNWKFCKASQIWLIKHWTDVQLIDQANFDTFLQYITELAAESNARKILQEKANKVIEASEIEDESKRPSEEAVERARAVMQLLV